MRSAKSILFNLLLLFSIGSGDCFAQYSSHEIDSLNTKATSLYFIHPDSSLFIVMELMKQFPDTSTNLGYARSNNIAGIAYVMIGDHEKSKVHFQRSLSIMERRKNPSGIADVYNNLGALHMELEQWDEARSFYAKSRAIFIQLGDKGGEATACHNTGSP